jgi:hypothetical protein
MFSRVLYVALLVLVFSAFAYLWGVYPDLQFLTYPFRRRMFGDVIPLYATRMPLFLSDPAVSLRLVIAIVISSVCVLISIVSTLRRWPVWVCLLIAFLSVIAIDTSIAHIRNGNDSFVSPYLRRGLEYYLDVPRVNDAPSQFISNYPAISTSLSHHAGTHPPGGVLFLWVGSKLFGDSVDAAAWWSVCFGAMGVLPTYWLATMVIGRTRARRVLPLYLVTPNLVLFGATSMDIVFFAFGAAALAAMFWAMLKLKTSRILIAGGLYWLAAFMSFAVISLPILAGLFALLTAIRDPKRFRQMLGRLVLVGLSFVFFEALAELIVRYDIWLVAMAAMHRDFDGMQVTGHESVELWSRYSVANLAAFMIGTGLALSASMVVAAIMMPFERPVMRRRLVRLALATPLCLIAISISTLFTLETERVWLSVVPAMLVVAAGLRGNLIWLLLIALLGVQTFLTECTLYTHW